MHCFSKRTIGGAAILAAMATSSPAAATNYGYECVSNYIRTDTNLHCKHQGGYFDNLPNACPGMEYFNNYWKTVGENNLTSWENDSVYDTDFIDSNLSSIGTDAQYTDITNMQLWYFAGHGNCDYLDTLSACSTDADCSAGARCHTANGRCYVFSNRTANVCSQKDKQGDEAALTTDVRFGESSQTNGWAGVGTNGDINTVVFDNSCPFEPEHFIKGNSAMFAGMHVELGFSSESTVGGDTLDNYLRPTDFSSRIVDDTERVSEAWEDTSRFDDRDGLDKDVCAVTMSCATTQAAPSLPTCVRPAPPRSFV